MRKITEALTNLYESQDDSPVIVTDKLNEELLDAISLATGMDKFAVVNITPQLESVLTEEDYVFDKVKIDSKELLDMSGTHVLIYHENETADELGTLFRELLMLDTEYDFYVIYVTKHLDPFEFEAQAIKELHESFFKTDIELSTIEALKNIYDEGDNESYPSTHYINLYFQVPEDKVFVIEKYEKKYPSLVESKVS